MRSDPPRFVRPRAPRLDSFVDRLEDEIRTEIRRNPPRRPHKVRKLLERLGRLMLRPVFHGGAVAVLLLVLLMGIRPQPTIHIDNTLNVDVTARADTQWADVVEVPDPSPKATPFIARERAPRFVAFAETIPEHPVGLGPF